MLKVDISDMRSVEIFNQIRTFYFKIHLLKQQTTITFPSKMVPLNNQVNKQLLHFSSKQNRLLEAYSLI